MPEMTPQPDDGNLLSFEQIHKAYHPQIYDIIFRLVGDAGDAEDLTLETFVNAYRHWDQFRCDRALVGNWLYKIAVNNCQNKFKSRRSALQRAVEALPTEYREVAMQTAPGDWKIWADADVATDFANRRRAEFLDAATQFSVMLRLLRRANVSDGPVLDMGCGSGVLLEAVLTAYPNAAGVALDGSAPMLVEARERLSPFAHVAFVEADFNSPDWVGKLPRQEYAAIVSGFAIHHSEDDRKRELYGEIFRLLRPGGVFINVEHVASATPLGEELFVEAWIENTVRIRQARGQEADYASIQAEFANRPDKDANRLAPVETQLEWLRAHGFADVDCYWKHFELAILAGYRPQ